MFGCVVYGLYDKIYLGNVMLDFENVLVLIVLSNMIWFWLCFNMLYIIKFV